MGSSRRAAEQVQEDRGTRPASSRAASRRYALPVGLGLAVGATSCGAAPIGLWAVGRNAMEVAAAEPVPWRDAADALPFAFAVLATSVVVGTMLGAWLLPSVARRPALARRMQSLVVVTGLSCLGWATTALSVLLPFLDANTTLTGLPRSGETTIVVAGGSITALLALSGAGVIVGSTRIADALADRVFGLDDRSCPRCGYPAEVGRCPECGYTPRRFAPAASN